VRLARTIRTSGGTWWIPKSAVAINTPPIGTIVQYKLDVNGAYAVYFPGILGYAPMDCGIFWRYFEDLDNETS